MQKIHFIFLILLLIPHAYGLEVELNNKSYSPNDKLVIFGTAIPNDSLIIELFNPTGNLIYRSQIDVDSKGEFAKIILIWPTPDDKFRVGVYTLTLTSSINKQSVSTAFMYQLQTEDVKKVNEIIIKKLDIDLAIPSTTRLNQTIPIIAKVTLNDVPLTELESINGIVKYPDGKEITLNNFTAINEGLYEASFTSDSKGYNIIIVNAKHEGIAVNKAFIINVEDDLDVDKEFDMIKGEIDTKFDILDKISNDTLNITSNVSNIKKSIDEMTSSIAQLTSLLLPIIGMIVIIVVLQATILAKRK